MSSLKIKLLGGFGVSLGSGEKVNLKGRKTEALLACLALRPGEPYPREKLVALLWGERGERQARASLRQALSDLRKVLDRVDPQPLLAGRDTLVLEEQAVEVDVTEFERLAAAGTREALEQAATLYEGEFLDGNAVRGPAFEEWLNGQRAHFLALARKVLANLVNLQSAAGDKERAIATAKRLLLLDPLHEGAHRALIRLYAATGDRGMAFRQYQVCRETLRTELGVDPEPETERLHEAISADTGGQESAGHSTASSVGAYSPTTPEPTTSFRRGLALGVGLAALVIVGGLVFWLLPRDSVENRPAAESVVSPLFSEPALAVLPFTNMSGETQQDYFADGIADDLITDLSRFPSLRVASRSATEAFRRKPADIRQIGQDLGVQYVVEGSVEKTADRIRVTAKLTEADTGTQLWAQRFDRELLDLFAVRDEIRAAIVGAITGYTGPISKAEQQRASRRSADHLTARDLYYRAYFEFSKFEKDANSQARMLLEKSIALDPDDVGAHWLLAWVHWRDYWVFEAYGPEGGEKILSVALAEARKSVELDETDYRGHWVLGAVLRFRGESDAAMAAYERAFNLNPNDPDMLADWGEFLSYGGQPERAVSQLERAMKLNPFYPHWYASVLSRAYHNARQYEKAIELTRGFDKILLWHHKTLAASYAQIGRLEEARAEIEAILELRPEYSIKLVVAGNQSLDEGLLQHLLDGLRKAGLPEQ